jgi:plastocyanin
VDGGYAPMNLDSGDTITFNFYKGAHDVVLMKDEAALESCDFTDKTEICDVTGENVQDGTIAIDGAKLSYTWTPTADGTYYISCTVGQHCARGQILTVTVGGSGPAGYDREGHESSEHDHSSHSHGNGHGHSRRLSSHSAPKVSCDPAANTAAPTSGPTSTPAADPADSFASLVASGFFLAGLTW